VDDDCNALVDDNATDRQQYYRDVDMDGWGNTARFRVACDAPAGWLVQDGDCADGDPAVHPGALDVCNGVDDDCNGVVDDGADGVTWYADRDGDGFGKPGVHQQSCGPVPGFVDNFSDCVDEDRTIFPGAPEVCDGLDNDCNALVDDNPVDGVTAFIDRDADGFGLDSSRVQVCSRPGPEWVDRGGDCNDNAISTFPGAPEVCDGRDQNCDGLQDDGNVCPCPVDWYGDHAYAVCDLVAVPWVVAGQICRGGGYELVTVDDAAENTFLTDVGGGLAWWIGYNDRGRVEGRYRWASGLASTYENWAPGEPNNAGNEDCVELLSDGTWNDLPCGFTHPFICESPGL